MSKFILREAKDVAPVAGIRAKLCWVASANYLKES
jgi:hypothetical protein